MFKKYIYLIVNLLLLIPLIIAVYSYAYNYIDKETHLLEEKSIALKKMKNIYAIISNQQKIRGLSNIEVKSNDIFKKIEILENQNLAIAKQLKNDNIFQILSRHKKGTIADFDTYTSDIEALLLIYKLTAYNAKLTLNSDITEYMLSKSITNTLPYIVEYFARIRGLASSVYNHKLDKKIKLRIENQLYMIKELLKNTQEMKYFTNAEFIQNIILTQQKEIKYIQNELLQKEYISQSGLEIFSTISKNIYYLNKLYYKNLSRLSNFYSDKINQKNNLKMIIILVGIGSIIIVVLINLFYFSKIQKYIAKVEHLNIVDPMTGLYNRRFLENYVEKFISRAEREQGYFSILMIDIDFFKKVNDTYGHDIGDKVIISVAQTLQNNIRKSDLAIRYGGEEFMVLLHYANADAAKKVATKIKDIFESTIFQATNKEKFQKTLSIGIAEFPKHTKDIWESIILADSALYVAKTTGRNKVVIYNEKIEKREN
jgi:diguanylate cyclase (GGDEF)-like protein